jgi:transcriptional/translational regulatory protein YebC/TACO1
MPSVYGSDPASNPRLQLAITNAKKASFPKASIEAAIARGQGLTTTGTTLESLTVEAMLPPSIAIVIECQTDSKARTLQDLRTIIKDHGGTLTSTSYLFQKRGKIVFAKSDTAQLNDVFDRAIEMGATDVEDEDGRIIIFTEPSGTGSVARELSATTGLKLDSSDIIWDPKPETIVEVDSEPTGKRLEACLATIHEDPSVQGVYLNAT